MIAGSHGGGEVVTPRKLFAEVLLLAAYTDLFALITMAFIEKLNFFKGGLALKEIFSSLFVP
jgi:hypothetical protein